MKNGNLSNIMKMHNTAQYEVKRSIDFGLQNVMARQGSCL
jgi:hypothetical protein